MKTSVNGYALIKANEVGQRGHPLLFAKDDCGKCQIGYGHDLELHESYPNGITEEFAETLLVDDVQQWEVVLNSLVPATCTQNQFDALIDFTHNCGTGALRQLLGHGWEQVPVQLKRWCFAHVKGKLMELNSLRLRRDKEIALFNTPE